MVLKCINKLALGLLLFFLLCSARAQTDKVKYIEVQKADFGIMAPIPMPCDKLTNKNEGFFVDTMIINATDTINFIMSEISNASPAPQYQGVDTRGKLIIHYQSGKKDSVCMGTTVIIRYNDQIMKLPNRKLVELIEDLHMKEW